MTPPQVGWPRMLRTEPRSAEPFPGTDRTGMPDDLATAENNAQRRVSPARHDWPELAKLDERANAFEQRQAEVVARIADTGQRLANAGRTDAERLADWQLGGERGPPPRAREAAA